MHADDILTHREFYFSEQLKRDGFRCQIHLWDSLFRSKRIFSLFFSPSFLTLYCFLQPFFPSLSHSSTSHFEPTLEVSGFYSWFTLAPPILHTPLPFLLHPFSTSFFPSASSSSSSSTSCWPLPVMTGLGGFNEQRGVGWFSLTHVISSTSLIPNSYVPSFLSLSSH